ncbi:SGNH hydrolase-type esterase domain-containing protein [Apodospora peruviana]|uniref:SGNH hydrolase-type esterase domain-containing protein n=1 Tax=Apodospora peruviana TaxID=516989 RepID=A0AAE0LY93_9PEZI|nr:SGNH hydrolase-type esterase domain-containing protein [Apodospora peruviana]
MRNVPCVSLSSSIRARQDGESDLIEPTDLTHIKKLAAIGDSYSAGIGAGDRLGNVFRVSGSYERLGKVDETFQKDYSCSRYNQAFPYLSSKDPRLGNPKFDFKSCSGAVVQDVVGTQIPSISDGQDAILLSIGGNATELTNVLNQLGLGCDEQLKRTEEIIASDVFSKRLDEVIDAARKKLAKGGKIYYTGYAKFFAEDLSPDCDKVSWATFLHKAVNNFQPEAKLTKDHRERMNNLVDNMNSKIGQATFRAADSQQVVYVYYDGYIGEFGGRYYEAGVDESTTESNKRKQLMFYELNTLDQLGNTPFKRSSEAEFQSTFMGTLAGLSQIQRLVDPDSEFKQKAVQAPMPPNPGAGKRGGGDAASAAVALAPPSPSTDSRQLVQARQANSGQNQNQDKQVPNFLPDGYGRVFHPQILLHQLIANLVMWAMANEKSRADWYTAIPEQLVMQGCHWSPPPLDLGRPAKPTPPPPPKDESLPQPSSVEDQTKWTMTLLNGQKDCSAVEDSTLQRVIWGDIKNAKPKCYNIGKDVAIVGTNCAEKVGNGGKYGKCTTDVGNVTAIFHLHGGCKAWPEADCKGRVSEEQPFNIWVGNIDDARRITDGHRVDRHFLSFGCEK